MRKNLVGVFCLGKRNFKNRELDNGGRDAVGGGEIFPHKILIFDAAAYLLGAERLFEGKPKVDVRGGGTVGKTARRLQKNVVAPKVAGQAAQDLV